MLQVGDIATKIVDSVVSDMKKATYKTPEMIALGVLHYAEKYGLEREFLDEKAETLARMILIRLNGSI